MIELIDGLMMIDSSVDVFGFPEFIVAVAGIIAFIAAFTTLITMTCGFCDKVKWMQITGFISLAVFLISIFTAYSVSHKYSVPTYDVVITDNTKCTYEDILRNYNIDSTEGIIYTIYEKDGE